ncbi:AAA family ATPase [Pseudomonas sp. Irchel s3f10]|uniref:AAA family ATPase n=1 Tax=Pseudomonas sp. Irchel s3f10 TaxID=2009137 RepID=UPI001595DBE2|nr:AAA family ATPase [Pseudomonas sp. Irchel s3f10]
MKILKISITKLFGIFDHDIPLNQNPGITIILGENGIGKTKVLEAISAIFRNDYNFLIDLDFETLSIFFDTDEVWDFSKSQLHNESTLYVHRRTPGSKSKPEKLSNQRPNAVNDPRERRRREMEFRKYEMMNSHYAYESKDVHALLLESDYLEYKYRSEQEKIKPVKWFIEETKKIKIRLIETQRIITRNEISKNSYESAVTQCSNELKELISIAIKSSADITSALDSTYPNRLVQNLRAENHYTYSQLNDELSELNEKRKTLSAAGLVVDAQDSELAVIEDEHNDLIIISMRQYVEDSKLKLEPYEKLAEKIGLFMDIVSNRFKHKNIKISKDDGIVFTSIVKDKHNDSINIDLTKLSSGEQHELVLFYKLIFGSAPGDLILIDEPELSLHISWQTQFIDDLKRVAALSKFSAVIATHSPDIISSNWDLRVELLGVE